MHIEDHRQFHASASVRHLTCLAVGNENNHRRNHKCPAHRTGHKEYVDRGKVRYVGISDVTVEQIERARKVLPIIAVQNAYNLTERKHDAVVDYCTRENITFVAYYPLHGEVSRVRKEIAQRHHVTPSQIALAWLLRRSPIMLPIPGTLSLEHLKENLAAVQIELSDAEVQALNTG